MKNKIIKANIVTAVLFTGIFMLAVGTASAQSDGFGYNYVDVPSGYNYVDTSDYGTTNVNSGTGYNYVDTTTAPSTSFGYNYVDSSSPSTTFGYNYVDSTDNSGYGTTNVYTNTPTVGYTGSSFLSGFGGLSGFGYTPSYYSSGIGYTTYGYTNYGSNPTTQCPSGTNYVNGVCQPNTQCPSGTNYVNGVCVPTTQCPAGTTYSNGSCVVNSVSCPSGTTLVNGACVVNTTTCPAGTTLVNGVCTTNITTCPAGTTLINGVCTTNIITPTYVCPNGTTVNYSYQCHTTTYTYQTCWDGTTIPLNSVCPNQYKLCPNGTSIPVNQTCYYGTTYTYAVPQTIIKFNNVVTSPATQVTNNSGRCNGIGLIANGAASTGWFEYGETSSLGRETAHASIGNNHTAPFSNLLTNLKPNTRYYCRAVMQNQYGVVKGEIVGFTTKGTKVTYVTPVVKTVVKKVEKKPEVTCTDGTTSWVKNGSATVTSTVQGDKLVALTVDNTFSRYAAGSPITYKISYKNLSDSTLTGVLVSVVLPAEIEITSASAGTYDVMTRTLTANVDILGARSEGTITIEGVVSKDASIGKSVVTTGYIVYTVPSTKLQDEVTAYTVGSISPSDATLKSDTGAKKVYDLGGSERSFLPNTLVEWLALIAIVFIVFILARSIYLSYQGDKEGH